MSSTKCSAVFVSGNDSVPSGGLGGGFADAGELSRVGAQGPRQPVGRDASVAQTRAQVVPTPLGHDVAIDRARFVAHSARQITQPEAKAGAIEVRRDRS